MSGSPKVSFATWIEQERQRQLQRIATAQTAERAEAERRQREEREAATRARLRTAVEDLLPRLETISKDGDAGAIRSSAGQTRAALLAAKARSGSAKGAQLTALENEIRQADSTCTALERNIRVERLRRDGAAVHAALAQQLADTTNSARLDAAGRKQATAAVAELARGVDDGSADIDRTIATAKSAVAGHLQRVADLWATQLADADAALSAIDDKLGLAESLAYVRAHGAPALAELMQRRRALHDLRAERPDEVTGPCRDLVRAVDELCARTAETARQDAIRQQFADQVARALVQIGFGSSIEQSGETRTVTGTSNARSIVIELTLATDKTRMSATFHGFPPNLVEHGDGDEEFATCDEAESLLAKLRAELAALGIDAEEFAWLRRGPPDRIRRDEQRLQQRQQQTRHREQRGDGGGGAR